MLTMMQILGKTPEATKLAAEDVKVINLKVSKKKSGNLVYTATTYAPRLPNGKRKAPEKIDRYVSSIQMLDASNHVKVSCSCPYFTYWGAEWALNKQGAADIIYSNGEAPDIRNPRYHPYCCKHLVALAERLRRTVLK